MGETERAVGWVSLLLDVTYRHPPELFPTNSHFVASLQFEKSRISNMTNK